MASFFDKLKSNSNESSSAPAANASAESAQNPNKPSFQSKISSAQNGTKPASNSKVGFKSPAESLAQKQATYNDKNQKVFNSRSRRFEYWSQADLDAYDKTHGEPQWASDDDIKYATTFEVDDADQIEYSKDLERRLAEAQKKRQREKEIEAQKKIAYDPNGNTYSMDDNGITVTDPNTGATNTYPTGTPEYNSAVTQYFPNPEQPTQSAYSEEDPATVPTANDMTSYNAQTAANAYQERGRALTDKVRQAEEEAPLFPTDESVDAYAPKTTSAPLSANPNGSGPNGHASSSYSAPKTGFMVGDLSTPKQIANNVAETSEISTVDDVSNALSKGYTIKDNLERQQMEEIIDDAFYAGQLDYSQYIEYMQSIADSYRRTEQEQQRVRSVGGY